MNILWINHEYPPIGGGGATATKALAREFAALGHKVTVVSAAFQDTPHFETADGVDIYRLKCKRRAKDHSAFFEMLSFLTAAFRSVPKLVRERGYEKVIISFGIPSGPLGWYLLKRYKLPYVVRLGGGDVPGTQKRYRAVYALLKPALRVIWKNADYVIANSNGLRERAERFYGKADFAVIGNGADISSFTRNEKPEPADREGLFRLITTARIVERKGIQHVIEALPRIIAETNGNVRYTVAGDGPYRGEIEALAERLGVMQYVEITGMIPFDDVITRLSEADVFVLASHWEGMPNAVIEAMASHLPVIMSNCEGSAELVDGNGFIVKSGESIAAELADRVLRLYNDRALMSDMGQKSYARACEHFSWKKCAGEYLKLLGVR